MRFGWMCLWNMTFADALGPDGSEQVDAYERLIMEFNPWQPDPVHQVRAATRWGRHGAWTRTRSSRGEARNGGAQTSTTAGLMARQNANELIAR